MTDHIAPQPGISQESPEQFLRALETVGAGWSKPLGGPEGVALLMGQFQQHLSSLSEQIAAVRASAITELLKTRSVVEVAQIFGVSRAAIYKAAGATKWRDARW